jgi:hypothetical protein
MPLGVRRPALHAVLATMQVYRIPRRLYRRARVREALGINLGLRLRLRLRLRLMWMRWCDGI